MDFHREQYAILERFLDDPRTTNMIYAHHTSIHQAVIVRRGQILATGINRLGNRSDGCGYYNSSIHAEVNALKNLGNLHKLRGASMYIMRFSRCQQKDGYERFMFSEPCPMCKVILNKCTRVYGLKNIYYTAGF